MARKSCLVPAIGGFLLASCGGGGGGGGPPAPVNRAPAITSAGAATVAENTAGTVYQAAATDADGDAIVFTLSGADAARFALTPAGALSFVAPPDFEAPADSGANNVYDLILTASDGSLTAQIALTVTVTNLPDTPTVRLIASGYDRPRQIVGIPGSANLFVVESRGRIFLLDPTQQGQGALFMTVGNIGTFDTNASGFGLLSVAPAPDYSASGRFYVAVTDPAGVIEIRRYLRSGPASGDAASADVILRIPTVVRNGTAIAAWMVFGPDGLLYILTAEGGDRLAPQNTSDLRGKILRIDVSQDAFPADPARDYALPADNPRFNGVVSEVYAYGLHNPKGASFNGADLLFGDTHAFEEGEINLLRPPDRGANYGFPLSQQNPPAGVTPAVILVGTNQTAAGGYVYRGSVLPLRGLYLFGGGRLGIHSVPAGQLVQGTTLRSGTQRPELNPPGVDPPFVESFAEDSQGELYFLARPGQSGAVYKIEGR